MLSLLVKSALPSAMAKTDKVIKSADHNSSGTTLQLLFLRARALELAHVKKMKEKE